MKLAFIGGTGPEGLGLAVRFAAAGEEVIIGSRSAERAQEAAAKIVALVPTARVSGAENPDAARQGEVVFITVPFEGQRDILLALREAIGAKLVVDTVVPLAFEKGRARALSVAEGSATQQAQALLPQALVTGAFHNLSAQKLMRVDEDLGSDVIVVGDDPEARRRVMALAGRLKGVRGIDGGPLVNARYVEELTALILNINRTYKVQAGIKLTGI
ncbi:MAG: NADPH-dependent F420 reductase [Dehalococcoidia bacterium]|nr:NADPH-dependent F420 reductase [Dehalococcoidia bacterium]